MEIGTITFHGSHNYGSVLQAYALQKFVTKLLKSNHIECNYKIINYRSLKQKKIYSLPKPDNVKDTLKYLMYLPYKKQIDKQYDKFEQFIIQKLEKTEEITTDSDFRKAASHFDVLIAGSDQIWNIRARDFDFNYLFKGCGKRKISYAASLGPLQIDWGNYDFEQYAKLISEFSAISVREKKSKETLNEVIKNKSIEILPDPTFLLEVHQWREIQSAMNPGKYIFFYCLEPTKEQIRIAKMFSKRLNLPVVTTKYRNRHDYINPFIKQYDAGPCDFLSLIDNATLVLTSSFHGTVFSLIYEKPFYVFNGEKDGRICDVLKRFGAEENSLVPEVICTNIPVSIRNTNKIFSNEREKAKSFLYNALNM